MAERRTTSPREWALALGGGLLLATVLVLWLRPPSPAVQDAAPAVALTPAPLDAPVIPPMATPANAPATNMILRGVLLPDAAVIETDQGRQWLVRRGRESPAGLRLVALSPTSATLETRDGTAMTLLLEGEDPPPPQAVPATARGPRRARRAELAATVTEYRLALRAVETGAGPNESRDIPGWRVRDASALPLLRIAGLQAGDVLLAVNGQPLFSEEKLMELPAELAGSARIDLEFSRGGQKSTVSIQIDP